MTKRLKVLSVCGFSAYWGRNLPPNILDLHDGPTVGGGEEASIRTAVGLRALGHEVLFYWYGQRGQWRGVEFLGLEDDLYGQLQKEKWDAVVGWSTIRPLEWAPKGARRLFAQQLNDLWNMGDWSRVDCIVSPSQSHAEQLPGWGWKKRPYAVVHNGLDPDVYGVDTGRGWAHPIPWEERGFDVGYWSSPDRGLHHLLRAWPLVVAAEPRARLHVFYEIDRYLAGATASPGPYGDRARLLQHLIREAKQDSTVTFHGAVPRHKLAATQRKCRVQCYPYDPTSYCEGFGGAVNQGIAAGCLVMTTPKDAFPSLYGPSIHWLADNFASPEYPAYLASQVVDGLHHRLPGQEATLTAGRERATRYSWGNAAKEFEAACLGEGWKLTEEEA